VKLIFAVVQDKDAGRLMDRLVQRNHSATKLASTGGFLREGNTTLLIGVEDEDVEDVLQIIRDTCHSRKQVTPPVSPVSGPGDVYVSYPLEVVVGGATVFVLSVERYIKI